MFSVIGLLTRPLVAEIGVFAQALLKKIGLKELALTVLLGRSFLLLMGLLVLTKLALAANHFVFISKKYYNQSRESLETKSKQSF